MREWQKKFKTGEYISEWNGYAPFYVGCFYGGGVILGGEEKFKHCYGFFAGIGDVEWWVKEELDKLSQQEQSELLEILKRNKKFYEYKNSISRELSKVFGVDSYQIYRLSSLEFKQIKDLIDSKANKVYELPKPQERIDLPPLIEESDKSFYERIIGDINK